MAQTKVKLISDGVIVQGNLHASHGITTAHIGEGSNLYYTDVRVGSYLSTNSFATESYVGTQIANLVDSSPATLDTLNELAAALGDDPNFATTTATSIGTKLPLAGGTLTGNLTVNARGFFNSAASYPLATSSGQRYNIQIRNTNNTVNSGYGWWLATDTNFNFALHADGSGDKFTLTRTGNATFAGTINSDNITVGKADGNNSSISLTANTGNWTFTNVQSSRNLEISDSDGTGVAMTIDTSANTTFAGNVTVGNNGNINIPSASSGNANLNFDGTDFKITSNSSSANLKLETSSTTRLTINSIGRAYFAESVHLIDDKALNFGTSNAFNLRWSTAAASGQGASIIDSNRIFIETNFFQLNSRTGESMIRATGNGDVGLYYNNSQKLKTTSTGVNIIGDNSSDKPVIKISAGANGFTLGKTNQAADYAHFKPLSNSPSVFRIMANTGPNYSYMELWGTDFEANQQNYNRLMFYINGSNGNGYIKLNKAGNSPTGNLYIGTASNENTLTILNSGNVGIGTTSPDYQLDIENSSHAVLRLHAGVNSSASLRLKNDAQDWDLNTQTNDTFAIYNQTSGTQPFSILPNGNVGIGRANPDSLFQTEAINSSNVIYGGFRVGYNGTSNNYYDADTHHFRLGTGSSAGGNLMVGGGIYLGGTAATNKLNYYEEGNWTPIIAHNDGTGVVPLTVNSARYIRVGQLVYVSAYLTGINPNGNAGGSGAYYGFRNFPFQPENYGAWQIVYASSGITAYGGYSSSASLYFMANGTNGQRSQVHVNGAGVNAWGSNLTMMFNCVYNING